jgi:deazaflavin-dependent oxidoreductase (nitroreductase family)
VNVKDTIARVLTSFHHGLLRVSGGRAGSRVMGMPVVVLETTGRKSGEPRRTMLTAPVIDGDTVVLVASYGGDDRHPQWYRNLCADPNVTIERDGARTAYVARTATADEKAALWPRITKTYKGYAGYQKRTDRDIPVVLLTPR